MIHREVMQQALSALEKAHHAMQADMAQEEVENAIDALNAALAEPQDTEGNGWMLREVLFDNGEPIAHREPICKASLQVEPVAKVELMTTGGNAGLATRIVEIEDHLRERLRPGQMLYTHPFKQRQPLTNEEIIALRKSTKAAGFSAWSDSIAFGRAIEKAHEIGAQK